MSTTAYVMCLVARHLDVALTSLKSELLELSAPCPVEAGESAVLVGYSYGGMVLGEAVLFGVWGHVSDEETQELPFWQQAA